MSRSAAPLSKTLGPYRLGDLLGKGGMGRVYRAYDQRLDRWVAAKRLHLDATERDRKRFRREARTLARLGHPAIVQIFDIVEDDGDDWIVMELIDGPTLASLRRSAPIDPGRAIDYGRQIVSALEAAHSHGIIHRDLKSENVMLLGSGHVKVLDFGLASRVGPAPDEPTWSGGELSPIADPGLTEPGRLLGTPRTMSPEQILELGIDERSDLFSLGVLFYEILTGRAPFVGGAAADVMRRVVYDSLPPLVDVVPEVPPKLSALVARLLEKEPAARPQTAAEVASELAAIHAPEAEAGKPEPHREPAAGHAFVSEDTPYRSLGERRQVTVLCCDLARATEGSVTGEKPGLELLGEALPAFLDVAETVVERYHGTLGALTGSRTMAYFGYPAAYEDGAVRAVRAALELLDAWRSAEANGERLGLRVGIHSGQAVVAPGESQDPLMLGTTFDHTVEVQSLAGVDMVMISAATRQLAWRAFELEAVDAEVDAWRVVRAHEPQADAMTVELLPMVSRDHELELMLGRWRSSAQGRGQVILVSGEAGIGKSRLIRAFRGRLPDGSTRWWTAHGSPFLQDSPLAAISEMLRHEILRRQPGEAPEVLLDRLVAFLDHFDLPRDEMGSLLAHLLEIPTDGRWSVPELAPDARRHQVLEALVALFTEMADQHPWVLAIEDLHWMDPSTLELLGRIVERAASTALCVVATCRPDGLPSWQHEAALTRIHLDQLADDDGGRLIDHVAGGRALPPAVRGQILARADGVPLFLEELTKTVLEAESGPDDDVAIPSTLRDSLTARLDRLGSAKQVAETAATIGRTFTLDLLAAVDPRGEAVLRAELDRLSDAGLIFRKGFGSSERFLFKHALIHDIAYDALLRKDRQALHRRLADTLVERAAIRDGQPALIAHHLTEAGAAADAVPFWRRAGQAALAASAHLEARRHLERALGLLEGLADRAEHRDEELTVLGGLGTALILDAGFTAPEVEAVWQRAHSLCEQSGGVPSFDLLWGLYAFHSVRGEWWKATSIVDNMLRVASEGGAPILDLQSRFLAGVRLFFVGRPADSLVELDRAAAVDASELGPALIASFAQDSRVMVQNYRAFSLWLTGATDAALDASARAQETAAATGHPFTVSTTLLLACVLDLFRHDGAAAEEKAERLIELSRHHGMYQDRDGRVLLGCARALRLGDHDPMSARELAGTLAGDLEVLTASGSRVWTPFYTAHLAAAWRLAAELDHAAELLDESLADIEAHGECCWQAELVRLRGDVELARGHRSAAAERYAESESIAAAQGADALLARARAASAILSA